MVPRSYAYRHQVALEDTNLVGNVYFANHVRWQGRCRELFLRDHAPAVLDELAHGLALVTTSVSCTYLAELQAFDVVDVRMSAGARSQNQLELRFEYWRLGEDGEQLVARGAQWVASMRREGDRLVAEALPSDLVRAIDRFTVGAGDPRRLMTKEGV